ATMRLQLRADAGTLAIHSSAARAHGKGRLLWTRTLREDDESPDDSRPAPAGKSWPAAHRRDQGRPNAFLRFAPGVLQHGRRLPRQGKVVDRPRTSPSQRYAK